MLVKRIASELENALKNCIPLQKASSSLEIPIPQDSCFNWKPQNCKAKPQRNFLLIVKDSQYQGPDHQRKIQVRNVEKRNFHGPWKLALKEQKLKDHKNKPNKEKKNRYITRSCQKKYKTQKREGASRNQNVKVKVRDFILLL